MKHAIIVGASSGMGLQVAKILLEEGWKLGLAARRTEPLEALSREYPSQVEVARIDVMSEDAPQHLLELIERMGVLNLYFNVAGIGKQNKELNFDVETDTVATNCMGFTRMVDTVFNYMAEHNGGHIAVISSIAGTKGLGPAPSYSASKAFQNNYIQALEQLAYSRKLPISFTDIRPGFVDTPLLNSQNYPMLMKDEYVARRIIKAIKRRKHVKIIDWRYRIVVFFWRLIPDFIWRRLNLVGKTGDNK